MKRKIAIRLDKAIKLYSAGNLLGAEKIYKDILRRDARNDNALRLLGMLENKRGHRSEAIKLIRRAISINPRVPAYYNNLGEIYRSEQNYVSAIKYYKKAISLNRHYAQAYNNLGCALQEIGMTQEAKKNFLIALSNAENYAEAHSNLGAVFQQLGQIKDAIGHYEKAIQIEPGYAEAHHNLSTIKEYRPDDFQVVRMRNILERSDLSEYDRMHLCFALAKAYGDLEEFNRSFSYLEEANRLRKNGLRYNIDSDRKVFAQIRNIFSMDHQMVGDRQSDASVHPIFIVGMMRSGTSLVEQILSSHSKVHGAGELETMGKLAGTMLLDLSSNNDDQLFQNTISRVHDSYISMLEELMVSEKVITDKMPINFLWIGFIVHAFPEAKIIHLNRDPMATCWSIYKHYFSGQGNGYAYNLDDLAEYYKLYVELMALWREKFPDSIYDIYYERLTENQEEETRRLLDYCGLEWQEQCLDFHKTERAVKTASTAQVRKKMYRGSSEAWRKYRDHLDPLIKGLGYQL